MPENYNAIYHLGSLYERIGGDKLQNALECFNKVLSLDQNA